MLESIFETLMHSLETGHLLAYPAALAAGLLVSFTPCVYPILPMTIGYIGARSAGSKGRGFLLSVSYVLGMATVYSALGMIAALTGAIFGRIATSPISYIVVGNVCILLGLSMLDVFNLRLPASLSSTRLPGAAGPAGGREKIGRGLMMAFVVGLASGLVVGPCTAPVLAVILAYVATRKNLFFGGTILFTFAFGIGILLIILGTFTGLLVSMPRAGAWLNRIKKAFGWILILAGQYFIFMAGRLSV